jgi:hypothetical protein
VRAVPRDPAVGLAPGAAVPVAAGSPLRARLPRRALLALAMLVAAGAVAAGAVALTAGGTAERAAPAGPVLLAGKPLQSANCTAWWTASPAEQGAAVAALTRSIGGRTTGGAVGTTLPADRVQRLFDRVCAPSFTSHFLLYEIYIRAAGLKSLGD